MRGPCKLIALLLILSSFLISCADLGAGDEDVGYADYFSKVIMMTPDGKREMKMHDFYAAIDLESSGEMHETVDCDDYRLIAFQVADGYTLTVREFAFFLRAEEMNADIVFEFYVTDKLPGKVGGNEALETPSAPPSETTGGTETTEPVLTEEDVFGGLENFYDDVFSLSPEWDSVHLSFDSSQTVKSGQYIVVRIIQNVCTCGKEDPEPAEPFTFNYFLFYISKVTEN